MLTHLAARVLLLAHNRDVVVSRFFEPNFRRRRGCVQPLPMVRVYTRAEQTSGDVSNTD